MKYLTKLMLVSLLFSAALSAAVQAAGFEAIGGDVIGRHIFGLASDYRGAPLLHDDQTLIYSDSDLDKVLLMGKREFVFSIFNQPVGQIYVTEWAPETLKKIDTNALNMASIMGLYSPTTGVSSAWGSLLVSEGGLIDEDGDGFINTFKTYFKGKQDQVKPYNYGWVAEIILLDEQGQAKAIKNYSMGRLFASEVLMMPDAKTFYLLDGNNSGRLYMFVSEQPNSLSKGFLYAISPNNEGVKYTLLGNVSALKMKFKLKKITFNKLFESSMPNQSRCGNGFTYISTLYGEECLKMKSRNKKYAGLIEPIRVMAIKGISGFDKKIINMSFDAKIQKLTLRDEVDTTRVFALQASPSINSNYVIKELL